jgi:hypothetical protein
MADETKQDNTTPQDQPKAGMHAVPKAAPAAPVESKVTVEEAPAPAQKGVGVEADYQNDAFDLIEFFAEQVIPEKDQIDAWKKEHGGVILVRYPYGLMFIHRLLSRSEYRELIYTPFPTFEAREDEIVKKTLLWPALDVPACFAGRFQGVPSTLSEYVLDRSGFLNAIEVGNA